MTEKLDLTALRSAISSLEDGLDVVNDRVWFDRQPGKIQNTLVAGVIQNFEGSRPSGYRLIGWKNV